MDVLYPFISASVILIDSSMGSPVHVLMLSIHAVQVRSQGGQTSQSRPILSLQNEQFGNLILRQIIKFVATICQILRLKCAKFKFGWGRAPGPDPQNP